MHQSHSCFSCHCKKYFISYLNIKTQSKGLESQRFRIKWKEEEKYDNVLAVTLFNKLWCHLFSVVHAYHKALKPLISVMPS